jgi:hypothetical protein
MKQMGDYKNVTYGAVALIKIEASQITNGNLFYRMNK